MFQVTESTAPNAPPAPKANQYFAGRCRVSGIIHIIKLSDPFVMMEITSKYKAILGVAAEIHGITNNGDFFAGVKPIVKPHVSLSMGKLYLQGSVADTVEDAVAGLVEQIRKDN